MPKGCWIFRVCRGNSNKNDMPLFYDQWKCKAIYYIWHLMHFSSIRLMIRYYIFWYFGMMNLTEFPTYGSDWTNTFNILPMRWQKIDNIVIQRSNVRLQRRLELMSLFEIHWARRHQQTNSPHVRHSSGDHLWSWFVALFDDNDLQLFDSHRIVGIRVVLESPKDE